MNETKKRRSPAPPPVRARVESVIKCKWSLTVLDLVRRGVLRPGAMERAVPGLTTKVLNERLRKLVRYEVLERRVFAELPPRVEYRLTKFGRGFVRVLRAIDRLEESLTDGPARPRGS